MKNLLSSCTRTAILLPTKPVPEKWRKDEECDKAFDLQAGMYLLSILEYNQRILEILWFGNVWLACNHYPSTPPYCNVSRVEGGNSRNTTRQLRHITFEGAEILDGGSQVVVSPTLSLAEQAPSVDLTYTESWEVFVLAGTNHGL